MLGSSDLMEHIKGNQKEHFDRCALAQDAEIKAVFNLADLMQMGVISESQASAWYSKWTPVWILAEQDTA